MQTILIDLVTSNNTDLNGLHKNNDSIYELMVLYLIK